MKKNPKKPFAFPKDVAILTLGHGYEGGSARIEWPILFVHSNSN